MPLRQCHVPSGCGAWLVARCVQTRRLCNPADVVTQVTKPKRRQPRYPPKACRGCGEDFAPWGSSVVQCTACLMQAYSTAGHRVVSIGLVDSHPIALCECAEEACSTRASLPPPALRDPSNTPWRCAPCRRVRRGRAQPRGPRSCDRCRKSFAPRGVRSRRCDPCIVASLRDDGHAALRVVDPAGKGLSIRVECRCPNCSTLGLVVLPSLARTTYPWWCSRCVERRPKVCAVCEDEFAPRGRSATTCDSCLLKAALARQHDALSVETNSRGHAVIRCRCRDCPLEKLVGIGQLRRYVAWRCPKCSHADPDYRRRLEEARRRHGRPTTFYVVSGHGILKVGLADGDGQRRLAMHARQGLSEQVATWFLADGGLAPQVEQSACWLIFQRGRRCKKTDLDDGYSEAIWCKDPDRVIREIDHMMSLICPEATRSPQEGLRE